MARKPSFKFVKTTSGWKVEIPDRLSPTGKRQRVFLATRDEAKEYAAELRSDNEDHGTNASVITPSLADEATRAAALLAPFGISLLEAARMAVISKNTELASSSIEDALTSFRKSKSNRSDAHVYGARPFEVVRRESNLFDHGGRTAGAYGKIRAESRQFQRTHSADLRILAMES